MCEHHHGGADSAGTPWAGRHFEPNSSADDDGSAPEALMAALERFRDGELDAAADVDVVRESRFLIPLLATLGESEIGEQGHLVDVLDAVERSVAARPEMELLSARRRLRAGDD